ncbi:MAG: T9SS type A sorting domain-containing protein [Bacteroidia bacterium]
MKRLYTTLIACLLTLIIQAQPVLKPSIGLTALPADNDLVCNIQVYTGSFASSGFNTGDTIPHFKLYSLNGAELDIATELSAGKPVLLIAGSYTCPVFRNKVPNINNIVATYGSSISTYIIYTVEAHPVVDVSPYSGNVWTTAQNLNSNILYQQPSTYGQRKSVVTDMMSNLTINAPVYIDGPCNEWWNNFGPAPNNAYLIRPDGVIFSKHAWYHQAPDNIVSDIDSLLTGTGGGGGGSTNGTFSFYYNIDSVATDLPGTAISIYATLINNSTSDAEIDIIRTENNLPVNWLSSMCTVICFDPNTDSTYTYIPAGDSISFSMHFYTDASPDTGNALITFKNRNVPTNIIEKRFYGITQNSVSINENNSIENISLYPNPANDYIMIRAERSLEYFVFTVDGKFIDTGITNRILNVAHYNSGMYFIKINSAGIIKFTKTY